MGCNPKDCNGCEYHVGHDFIPSKEPPWHEIKISLIDKMVLWQGDFQPKIGMRVQLQNYGNPKIGTIEDFDLDSGCVFGRVPELRAAIRWDDGKTSVIGGCHLKEK